VVSRADREHHAALKMGFKVSVGPPGTRALNLFSEFVLSVR
jgi:hypothetical protein